MECPRCAFVHADGLPECLRCGVVYAKLAKVAGRGEDSTPRDWTSEAAPVLRPSPQAVNPDVDAGNSVIDEARREFYLRAAALPLALLVARGLVVAAPGAVRMLAMWVHEAGHSVAAWASGFPALPGPWITVTSPERVGGVGVLCSAALVYGAWAAWRRDRWFWSMVCLAALAVQGVCTYTLYADQAQAVITFGGDGGLFVLGSVMMASVYARPDHPVREQSLRWALLAIGALAFMDGMATWTGNIDDIPFGEDDRVISDPSVLTEFHGWSVDVMIARYRRLAAICLGGLGVAYVVGLLQMLGAAFPGLSATSPREASTS